MRIIKENFILISIILFATFLRFYKLGATFIVLPETGQDLIIARDAILHTTVPLYGVVSSHTWLFFGPLYWWVLELFLFFSSFNPLSHAVLGRLGSVLIVFAIYVLVKRIVSKRAALVSAFLVTISPLFMMSARIGRHDSFSILFSIIFLYVLSFSEKKSLNRPLLLGLLLGIGINIEFTFLLMIPVLISFMILRKIRLTKIDTLKFPLGFVVPFLPLILLEIVSKQHMLAKMMLWVPYRILGFAGVIKSDIVVEGFSDVSYSFWKLIADSFLIKSDTFLYSLFLIPVVIGVYILLLKYKNKTINTGELLLVLATFWYIVGLIIHTNPPSHYFSEIYFVPIILFCYAFNFLWKNTQVKLLFWVLLLVITFVNLRYYFSDKWFYKNYTIDKSSYIAQMSATRSIVNNANGQNYGFARVGLFDDRKNDYADNYLYFLWLLGNEPMKNAGFGYILYDEGQKVKILQNEKKIFDEGLIIIVKKRK